MDRLSVQADDLARTAAFYDAVLAPLGGHRIMKHAEAIGYGTDFPMFWIGTVSSDGPQREVHIAFRASDRASVIAFRDAAVAVGATVLHEPRLFPEYHANYFGAFVRDPDGNNVEAVCHRPD